MNRYQHDNIDPDITSRERDRVLKDAVGINWRMSAERRAAKQARHRKNAIARRSGAAR